MICMSQLISDYMHKIGDLENDLEVTTYYQTSFIREFEVREAYKTDASFTIVNITSAIHGAVLKAMFPSITLHLPNLKPDVHTTGFMHMLEFLRTWQ